MRDKIDLFFCYQLMPLFSEVVLPLELTMSKDFVEEETHQFMSYKIIQEILSNKNYQEMLTEDLVNLMVKQLLAQLKNRPNLFYIE